MRRFIALLFLLLALTPAFVAAEPPDPKPIVETWRVPGGGVQPQTAVGADGVVHLVYLLGDPAVADVYYATSTDGRHFSTPLRVNSVAGSAIAVGTVRGAHLAVGRGGRAHVAWMGSDRAQPRASDRATPMLYARSNDDGTAFEPQRNVLASKVGLDGGGSVAADADGNVWVGWHAPTAKGADEQARRVWVVHSTDEGRTFGAEEALSDARGACGCCGMRLFASPGGGLFALYRSADRKVNRDMTLVRLDADAKAPVLQTVGAIKSGVCVMSTAAFARADGGALAAWETEGQIFWAKLGPGDAGQPKAIAAPGEQRGRKHPALAGNSRGEVLLAWTEGTGWNKGGSVVWQVYDRNGRPLPDAAGRADDLRAWGAPAAYAGADGAFVVLY